MKVRAKEKGFNFPYLFDESQQTGQAYGAVCTPHVFILDQNRKVAYIGAIDDNNKESKVEARYVRDALDAILAASPRPRPRPRPAAVRSSISSCSRVARPEERRAWPNVEYRQMSQTTTPFVPQAVPHLRPQWTSTCSPRRCVAAPGSC